jgi:hypothetical protein
MKKILRKVWHANPVLVLGAVGIAATTAADAISRGLERGAAVNAAILAIVAFLQRSRVTPTNPPPEA